MKWTEAHQRLVQWSSSADALTESQRATLAELQVAIEAGVPYINLAGRAGVGKTFLAKHLAHTQTCVYLSGPTGQLPAPLQGRCVMIDNLEVSRHVVRSTCNEILTHGARTALVITQERIRDSFVCIELRLTPVDENFVYERLAQRQPGVLLHAPPQNRAGLWALVAQWAAADPR